MSSSSPVALITGASQGIGAALVRGYRSAGFQVVAVSRQIAASADAGVLAWRADVGDRTAIAQLVEHVLARYGRIDTLVNNAGIFIAKPFTAYTEQDFHDVFNVNVAGFFHLTQAVLEPMLRQGCGHVVQITTSLVDQPLAGVPSGLASLSKGGLDAATRSLAIEYAGRGVRVNAVAPGIIKTPMHPAEHHAPLAALHPLGRMGEADEVVDAVLYLERAGFVTGQTLHVDGGQHAGRG